MDYDYKELGFRCGLEIHQRLDTSEKLFCQCSTDQDSEAIGKVYRMQRAVAGERGSTDRAALFEESKRRKFEYNLFRKSTCLVDADEEPPHSLNAEALSMALSLASAFNMHVVNEVEPMRKGVVNGSDTSAFQRTMLIGFDGSMEVNGNEIAMPTICLEEESCGIEKNYGTEVSYNVDRLGIPLIEIATFSRIPNPETAKETALHIGALLRITGKVKRGLGTIRQDVNVSIAKGARIEIKGLQDVSVLDRFIENEVRRQQELIAITGLLSKAKAKVGAPVDLTSALSGTKAKIISSKLEKGGRCLGFALHGFEGLLGREINPDRRLGTEISDYARTVGAKGIIHSDEDLGSYGLSDEEVKRVGKALGIKRGDSFIIIAEKEGVVENALSKARERAMHALKGIPVETREAINDGTCTSRFTRPLPGGARMYPETDVEPVMITREMLDSAKKGAPNLKKETSLLKRQLRDDDLVARLLKSTRLQLYKEVTGKVDVEERFVANVLLQKFTELSRSGYDVDNIPSGKLEEVFALYGSGRITKQAVDELLKSLSREDVDIDEAISRDGLGRITGKDLSNIIDSFRKDTHDKGRIIKAIMSKHRLNVDGEELNRLLKG